MMSQEKRDPKIIGMILLIVGIVIGGIIGYGVTAGQMGFLQTTIHNLQALS